MPDQAPDNYVLTLTRPEARTILNVIEEALESADELGLDPQQKAALTRAQRKMNSLKYL